MGTSDTQVGALLFVPTVDDDTLREFELAAGSIGEPSTDRYMGAIMLDSQEYVSDDNGEGFAFVTLTDDDRLALTFLGVMSGWRGVASDDLEPSGEVWANSVAAIVEWDDRGFHYVEYFDDVAEGRAEFDKSAAEFWARQPCEECGEAPCQCPDETVCAGCGQIGCGWC